MISDNREEHLQNSLKKEREIVHADFIRIETFLCEKEKEGTLTKRDRREITRAHNRVFDQAEIDFSVESHATVEVLRDSLKAMRNQIVRLHPEWEDDLVLSSGSSRRHGL